MKKRIKLKVPLLILASLLIIGVILVGIYFNYRRPQAFTLSGQVINSQGEALPEVNIYLLDFDLETITDSRGRFSFSSVKTGQIRLRAEAEGYTSYEEVVSGVGGNRIHLLITLLETEKDEALLRIKIIDEEDLTPIVGAAISVGEAVWYSNQEGLATIPVKTGLHHLEIIHLGYQAYRVRGVEAFAGKSTNLEIALVKEKLQPGTYGNLEVRVTDALTGRALGQVTVKVGEKSGVTDFEGYLLITEIPAKSHEAEFSAQGYLTYKEVVSIKVNENTQVQVKMFSGQINRGAISGTVKDSTSMQPLVEVIVESKVGTTRTDLEGRFVLTNLTAGPLTLSLNLPGYQPLSREVVIEVGKVSKIELFLDKLAVDINLTGVIRNFNQQPIARARVSVGSLQTLTGEDGKFSLRVRETGKTILVEKDGFYNYTASSGDDPLLKELFLKAVLYRVVSDGSYTGRAVSSEGEVEVEVEIKGGRISGLRVIYYEGSASFASALQEKLLEVAREILRQTPVEYLYGNQATGTGPKEVIFSAVRKALSLP